MDVVNERSTFMTGLSVICKQPQPVSGTDKDSCVIIRPPFACDKETSYSLWHRVSEDGRLHLEALNSPCLTCTAQIRMAKILYVDRSGGGPFQSLDPEGSFLDKSGQKGLRNDQLSRFRASQRSDAFDLDLDV